MKKKYNYLLIFLLLFFSYIENANAITFRNNKAMLPPNGLMYHRDNLDFSKTKDNVYNSGSVYKEYTKTDGPPYYNAFCSDKSLNYFSGDAYELDKKYNDAKCTYKVKEGDEWIAKTGGDCSQLVGYAIESAYQKAATLDNCKTSANELKYCKYGYAQAITWTYLALFTYDEGNSSYLRKNNSYTEMKYAYDNNPILRSIIQDAWTKYNQDLNTGKISNENENNDEGMYTISGGSTKFYYVPRNNQCGDAGGEYKTDDIIITNNKEKEIELTITNRTQGVTLHFPDINKTITGVGEHKVTLGTNKTIRFNLTSTQFIGSKGTDSATATVDIHGQLIEESTKTGYYTVYDSERWDYTGIYNGQGLILLTTETRDYDIKDTIKHKKDQELIFSQNRIETLKPVDTDNYDEGTGICANKAKTSEATSTTLKGAACKTIDLGNGRYVRIIISETITFTYGYLHPNKYENYEEEPNPPVFAGGGFNLNTNESLATTKYNVAIAWQFADKNLATKVPYFYNKGNEENSNPENAILTYNNTTKTVTQIINEILLAEITKKYKELTLTVDTFNSNEVNNDGNGISYQDYKFNVYENAQDKTDPLTKNFTYNSVEKTYEINFNIKKIELNRYKMGIETKEENEQKGKNGYVYYCYETDETCNNKGYKNRGYFVPMHYKPETFKFDITQQNISLVKEITLNYSGTCEIQVKNQFNPQSLRYRSITVNNPFPKATTSEKIPDNWKEWYSDDNNKKRIADTFTKKAIYKINITTEKANIIDTYNQKSVYTDWSNMNTTGSSDVVNHEGLFDKTNETNSYCGLGVFAPSCDQ